MGLKQVPWKWQDAADLGHSETADEPFEGVDAVKGPQQSGNVRPSVLKTGTLPLRAQLGTGNQIFSQEQQ